MKYINATTHECVIYIKFFNIKFNLSCYFVIYCVNVVRYESMHASVCALFSC